MPQQITRSAEDMAANRAWWNAVEELREKLRAIDQEEEALCRVHSRRSGRSITAIEELNVEEVAEWISLLDYAIRRLA